MPLTDNYYTVAEAADELNVTRQTIYRWIDNKTIKAEKIGRETLIEKSEVFRYKDEKVGNWLYEAFNIYQEKNNYKAIRKHFGYGKTDKIQRIGDKSSLIYKVSRENHQVDIVMIGRIHVSFDRKTGHLISETSPDEITRMTEREFNKQVEVEKEETEGE